jgi:hypothetical protein
MDETGKLETSIERHFATLVDLRQAMNQEHLLLTGCFRRPTLGRRSRIAAYVIK